MSNIRTLYIYRDIKDGLPAETEQEAEKLRAYVQWKIGNKKAMDARDGIHDPNLIERPSPEMLAKLPGPRVSLVK